MAWAEDGQGLLRLFGVGARSYALRKTLNGCGILWAWGVLCEVAMLGVLGGRTSARSGKLLLLIGGVGAMIRWTGTAFNPPFWSLILLQSLHGLTYGAMQIIRHAVPAHISTAVMGVYAAVLNGVVIGTVNDAARPRLRAYEGHGFLLVLAMGALRTVLTILFSRLWNGGLFIKSATNET